MEQKDIDIYEILKGMPDGTPLYTPMCGNVEFTSVEADKEKSRAIWTENENGAYSFDKHGKWMKGGEALLFPSKEMRDWSKFAWKKGDVLVSNDNDSHIIFKGFSKDDYTTFEGKYWISVSKKRYISCLDMQNTQDYHIEDNKDVAQTYINTIEEKLGGKLNLETLEIEKPKKPAFEIGKLYVFDEEDEDGNVTIIGELIGKYESEDTLTFGNQYEIENEKFVTDQAFDLRISVHEELREATEDEIELFEKWENGAKEQPDFKPFDKVLVRNLDEHKWRPAIFVQTRIGDSPYRYNALLLSTGRVGDFIQCIPFDGNENIAFTNYNENLPL